MRVLLAGGGTAGHTSPLLATADALRRLDPATEVTCLGTPRGLETRVVPEAGYPLELCRRCRCPRRPGRRPAAGTPARLRAAVARPRSRCVDRVRPDVVVGFGGYVSVPAYLAARERRRAARGPRGQRDPRHRQQGWAPGSTTARRHELPRHRPARARCTSGLPIRRLISTLDRGALRAEARAHFGLDADLPTLLVTGGSQGAARINQAVSGGRARPGRGRRAGAARRRAQARGCAVAPGDVPYVVLNYVDRMDLAYAAADRCCAARAPTPSPRSRRVGPAGGLRPAADRQRRAGAQRAPGRRRRRRRCWSTTPR